jgi:hypothetical protein
MSLVFLRHEVPCKCGRYFIGKIFAVILAKFLLLRYYTSLLVNAWQFWWTNQEWLQKRMGIRNSRGARVALCAQPTKVSKFMAKYIDRVFQDWRRVLKVVGNDLLRGTRRHKSEDRHSRVRRWEPQIWRKKNVWLCSVILSDFRGNGTLLSPINNQQGQRHTQNRSTSKLCAPHT